MACSRVKRGVSRKPTSSSCLDKRQAKGQRGSVNPGLENVQALAVAEDRRSFNHGGKFPDVSRPWGRRPAPSFGGRGNGGRKPTVPRREWRNVPPARRYPGAVPARRQADGEDGQAYESLAGTGRGDHVWKSRWVAATTRTSTCLVFSPPTRSKGPPEESAKPNLGGQGQLAKLVQEKRSAVGPFEPADPGHPTAPLKLPR